VTAAAIAATILRFVAAAIFGAQGWRKIVEDAGAPHGRRALEMMLARRSLPAPGALAVAVGLIELAGGAALLVGLAVRLVVLPLAAILAAAIVGFKREDGFLGGWDWPLSVLALVIALLVLGAGPWSLDGLLNLPI
jgi:putative oxidoreductase